MLECNLKDWFSNLSVSNRILLMALRRKAERSMKIEDVDNFCQLATKFGADPGLLAEFREACLKGGYGKS